MNTIFTWEREDGSEVEIDIEFTCSPYDPGNVCGPPDSCYPPEGGDIESIEFKPGDDNCTEEMVAEFRALYYAGGEVEDRVNEACFEAAQGYDDGPDYY